MPETDTVEHPPKPLNAVHATTPFILIQSMTLMRIPLSVLFGLLLVYASPGGLKTAFCLTVLVMVEATDALDGIFARRFNLVSEYGAMLDPYADSISRLIIYTSLASVHRVLLLVPLSMALRDVTVAYARVILAKQNRTVSAKRSGKVKAIFQAAGSVLALMGPYYWQSVGEWTFSALSWILVTVTLLSGVEYVYAAGQALKTHE